MLTRLLLLGLVAGVIVAGAERFVAVGGIALLWRLGAVRSGEAPFTGDTGLASVEPWASDDVGRAGANREVETVGAVTEVVNDGLCEEI